jgi:hypothetical protein
MLGGMELLIVQPSGAVDLIYMRPVKALASNSPLPMLKISLKVEFLL